ncbi:ATP-binding protein [Clostridium sp. OS1-26]|uniref:sensor histidine kinase n=1 Tax=Clostridium sp. OS1-26 TaxID=3070681 RepID=UPI0027E0B87A|nr:ATP-binding protein [Clostridium sp. OS1-26]WML32689.1 ATP-binding protein [Clostridium sp. OS1-26]
MKNNGFKFILGYISTIVCITLIVVILNYLGFIYFVRNSPYIKEPTKTVKNIAQELRENNNQLSSKTIEMIKNNGMWVQLVNESGEVIYNCNKPENINNHYSIKDIAILSKSYLKDYPVFLWESKENLVILGYPKSSIQKYNLVIPSNTKNAEPTIYIYIISLNIVILIMLSIGLIRVLNKPLNRLIKGIFSLKEEKKTGLKEKGIYKDLAKSINETSELIIDKNNKIKLRNNAIENWITAVSHDVRTPLSMILGYSAMIEEDDTLPEEVRSEAKIITENSLRLRELIANLNLATSLQYNMQPLTLSTVRLSNIAREAMVSCINSGILQNYSTDIIIEDENVTVMVDKSLILRAVINIITNSAKHNKEGCSITVNVPKAAADSMYASIVVSDDGSGISQEQIDKINKDDYFYTQVNQKHGLGLIIVRSIIDAHHGKFIIENRKDKGVAVTLRIPVKGSVVEKI